LIKNLILSSFLKQGTSSQASQGGGVKTKKTTGSMGAGGLFGFYFRLVIKRPGLRRSTINLFEYFFGERVF